MTNPWDFDELCRMGGQMLHDERVDVDFEALLWAIGGVESSFGTFFGPRHENAYCRGGRYFSRVLTRKHNCMAHCSYGPWQLMYANAVSIKKAITPELMLEPLHALPITVGWMRRVVRRGANTPSKIADAWNSGSHRDSIVPRKYIIKVLSLYRERVDARS
ncbi:hypothetical protein LCGC14_2215080 [marine sediment metagenome]|uniref:Transglycosylase SLT domain-containing protein n=1 Tax=marine sediment metagenome TaxID=412755 RepID=A0A0F9DCK6_9ZZZZ